MLLSVVIITKNEERNIGRCLDSAKPIADEILVVDSFSSDKTREICLDKGVRFIEHQWEGYSATKNYANALATYDWILSLDADEALSEELSRSVLELKKAEQPSVAKFNRLTSYCGQWIRHCGWYPDTKIRIFNRSSANWTGFIHETLQFTDRLPVLHLKGDCLHYSYYTRQQHLRQAENFTDMAAKELYRLRKKASMVRMLLSPLAKFIQSYFLQLGFLDAVAGFNVCRISAWASYLKYKKLRSLWKNPA